MSNTVEVIGTQQVLVTETAVNVVELVVPSQTAVVEVATAGPAGAPGATGPAGATGPTGATGPAGADAPLKTVKVDTSTAGTQYVGKALSGTAESAALWRIVKSTFSSAGVLLTSGTATNVTWTGRTGHTYT